MAECYPLILASASPRRRELLAHLGRPFSVLVADIDETPLAGEGAVEMALRLACGKARAVASHAPADALILAADTVVAVDDQLLGKPADRAMARQMLKRLSGRSHQVVTAMALCGHGQLLSEAVTTMVWMRPISDGEMDDYWDSGEPADKAGSYAIQGIGGRFVERIDGSYSNVVGLPLVECERLLQRWQHAAGLTLEKGP